MALSSFCGLLTLQVGSAMLAVVFFEIMIILLGISQRTLYRFWETSGLLIPADDIRVMCAVVFSINVLDIYTGSSTWPLPLVLVIIFTVFLLVSGIVMFMSAYNESRTLCIVSVVLISITMVYWVALSCLSFSNYPTFLESVCMRDRCGESFWLMDLRYRTNWDHSSGNGSRGGGSVVVLSTTGSTREPNSTVHSSTTETTTEPARRRRFPLFHEEEDYNTVFPMVEHNDVSNSAQTSDEFLPNSASHFGEVIKPVLERFKRSEDDDDDDDVDETTEHQDVENDDSKPHYKFGLPMVGAIILFIINFVYFLFTILIMWSYAQELKWSGLYDDTPSVSIA